MCIVLFFLSCLFYLKWKINPFYKQNINVFKIKREEKNARETFRFLDSNKKKQNIVVYIFKMT